MNTREEKVSENFREKDYRLWDRGPMAIEGAAKDSCVLMAQESSPKRSPFQTPVAAENDVAKAS